MKPDPLFFFGWFSGFGGEKKREKNKIKNEDRDENKWGVEEEKRRRTSHVLFALVPPQRGPFTNIEDPIGLFSVHLGLCFIFIFFRKHPTCGRIVKMRKKVMVV